MHDATKVLLGSVQSSDKVVSIFDEDPATFLAGLAVRLATGVDQLSLSSGALVGVSLGRSLSDVLKTAVCRVGNLVPLRLELQPARGVVTITSYANLVSGTDDSITVGATLFTAQAGAATPGDATFRAATDNATTAASLVTQINAHATAGALVVASRAGAVVTLTAKLNTTAGNAIALAYTDNDSNVGATVDGAFLSGGAEDADYVTIGQLVYINTNGKGDDPNSSSTVSGAQYASGVLDGIDEDGNEVPVALIDMGGGL